MSCEIIIKLAGSSGLWMKKTRCDMVTMAPVQKEHGTLVLMQCIQYFRANIS